MRASTYKRFKRLEKRLGAIEAASTEHHATILQALQQTKDSIMATQAELAADLSAVSAQVTKIGGETSALVAKVAELEAALAAGGPVTPEVQQALQALKDQVSTVDGLVADTVIPTP